MKSHFSLLLAGAAAVPHGLNRCRNTADGTKYPDLNDPQAYVECQNGQETVVQCQNDLYWDQHFQECQPKKACNAPRNWDQYNVDYSYADGIFYYTSLSKATQSNSGAFNARLLCHMYGGKDAMPMTDTEYSNMKAQQDRAIQLFLQSDDCVNSPNPNYCNPVHGGDNYEFWVGIEGILRDEQLRHPDFHYYEEVRQGSDYNQDAWGPLFTQNTWWKNSTMPQGDFSYKHVIQVENEGLINVQGGYRVDGTNCMFVCPGY